MRAVYFYFKRRMFLRLVGPYPAEISFYVYDFIDCLWFLAHVQYGTVDLSHDTLQVKPVSENTGVKIT